MPHLQRTPPDLLSPPAGNETISHLYERGNGRLTILFQAFQGAPRLLRIFGKGEACPPPRAGTQSHGHPLPLQGG